MGKHTFHRFLRMRDMNLVSPPRQPAYLDSRMDLKSVTSCALLVLWALTPRRNSFQEEGGREGLYVTITFNSSKIAHINQRPNPAFNKSHLERANIFHHKLLIVSLFTFIIILRTDFSSRCTYKEVSFQKEANFHPQ